MPIRTQFAQELERLWARDGLAVEDPALARQITDHFADGNEGVAIAAELLARSGVREQWNGILRQRRSAVLADRIRPLVVEPLVDVLAGDGAICEALLERGIVSVAATERDGAYPDSPLPGRVALLPFGDGRGLAAFNASTALVSTVLHHEREPLALLNALATAGIPRWIVVENCVTPAYSHEFHRFADRFFNQCLNHFDLHCVEQHRTLPQWVELLGTYGNVSVIDDAFPVPGIPFPYSLLVVDRNVSRS